MAMIDSLAVLIIGHAGIQAEALFDFKRCHQCKMALLCMMDILASWECHTPFFIYGYLATLNLILALFGLHKLLRECLDFFQLLNDPFCSPDIHKRTYDAEQVERRQLLKLLGAENSYLLWP